jgi:GPH family glycoside/pentoside/hexuronide:cation symporter
MPNRPTSIQQNRSAPLTSSEARVDPFTRVCYGIGSIAYGVKDNGFGYFLLFYYNQVLGLSSQQASVAILIALVLDAASDPIVGNLSDRFHSKWGRRHPFMYAAALPIALSFYFLWNPPVLSQAELFYYLILMAVLVRTSLTFFEVPSTALAPELTDSYDERTTLSSIRHFCGWVGGITIAAVAYRYLLVDTPEFPRGQLNPGGYELYGLLGSAMMFIAILVSAGGTHHRIPMLKQPPKERRVPIRQMIRETRETLSNRSFLSIFAFGIFSSIAVGVAGAMSIYVYTFYWELDTKIISVLVLSGFFSAVIGAVLAPIAAKRFGKKHAAMGFAILAGIAHPFPVALRLFDLMPPNGSDALLPTLVAFNIGSTSLIIATATLVSAMMADIVEESELATGRRSEGIFFAARSFITKSLTGFGIVAATIVLEIVQFPDHAQPGQVDPDIIWWLGAGYSPVLFGIFVLSTFCLSTYRLTREQHETNVEALRLKGESA